MLLDTLCFLEEVRGWATYSVGVFSVEHHRLASKHKVVAFWTKRDGDSSTEEDEGEDVSVLVKRESERRS